MMFIQVVRIPNNKYDELDFLAQDAFIRVFVILWFVNAPQTVFNGKVECPFVI